VEGLICGEPSNPCQYGKMDVKPKMMISNNSLKFALFGRILHFEFDCFIDVGKTKMAASWRIITSRMGAGEKTD